MDVLLRECIWLAIQLLMEMAAALAIDCAGGLVYTCVASAFFFQSRRRHTSFDCDWISDVCSPDLARNNPRMPRGLTPPSQSPERSPYLPEQSFSFASMNTFPATATRSATSLPPCSRTRSS